MTSFRQIEANRRNARKSTGPSLFQRPAGLPSERLFRQADVGLTLSWIVVG